MLCRFPGKSRTPWRICPLMKLLSLSKRQMNPCMQDHLLFPGNIYTFPKEDIPQAIYKLRAMAQQFCHQRPYEPPVRCRVFRSPLSLHLLRKRNHPNPSLNDVLDRSSSCRSMMPLSPIPACPSGVILHSFHPWSATATSEWVLIIHSDSAVEFKLPSHEEILKQEVESHLQQKGSRIGIYLFSTKERVFTQHTS